MARFFQPHSEGDVQVLQQSPGRIVLKIAWMPPAMRWKFFGVVSLVVAALLFFAAGPVVLGVLAPSILFAIAINAWSYTLVDVSPKRIFWKAVPFPARKPRKLKFREAAAFVHGQVYVKLSKRSKSSTTYAVGVRKKNGKIWTIQESFDSPDVPIYIAKLLCGAVSGKQPELGTLRGGQSASWQMMATLVVIPLVTAVIALIQFLNP